MSNLRLKCIKFNFGWGYPRLCWGAYSAPQTPLLDLRGLLLRGQEKRAKDGVEGRQGKIYVPLYFFRVYAHELGHNDISVYH